MLDQLKTQQKVVGMKQLRKALKNGQILKVFLAQDADPRLADPLAEECTRLNVELIEVPSMRDLGTACGIAVGAAAAGILA